MNLKNVLIGLIFLSGVIHLADGFEDGVEDGAIANGLLFAISGLVQVAIAFWLWKNKSFTDIFLRFLALVNGSMAALLILVHFYRAPFAPTPKLEWEALGIFIFVIEVASVALAYALYKKEKTDITTWVNWIFAPIMAAVAIYGLGIMGEQMFPSWILTEVL